MKKHIIFFTIDYFPGNYGGIGIHVYELVKRYKENNDVTVVLVRYSMDKVSNVTVTFSNGIKIIEIPSNLKYIQERYGNPEEKMTLMVCSSISVNVAYEIEQHIDLRKQNVIVHNHSYVFSLACEYFKYKYNIPIVSTLHHKIWNTKKDINVSLLYSFFHISDRCIFVSKWLKNTLEEITDKYVNKSLVIHNGVKLEPLKNDNIIYKNKLKICCVGSLIKRKGIDILIRSIAMSVHKDNMELTIIGKGNEYEALKILSNDYNINVNFMGYLEHKKTLEIMRNCNVVVMPSREETFSLVALEAMKEGRCLITSNLGGFIELINNGVNGFLFKSEMELSSLLDKILLDSKLLREISQNAYVTALDYSWDNMAIEVYKVYEDVFNKRRELYNEV